jgi:hypothetical protein
MNKYSGGNFDDFLKEEGIFEEVVECTRKRLLALQIEDCINAANLKGETLAEKMNADLVQLNHYLFDLDNTVITSELLDGFMNEAKEISTNSVQFNDYLLASEELLNGFLRKKGAA